MRKCLVWILGSNNICYEGLHHVLSTLQEIAGVKLITSLAEFKTDIKNDDIEIFIPIMCTSPHMIDIMCSDINARIPDAYILILKHFNQISILNSHENTYVVSCDIAEICSVIKAFSYGTHSTRINIRENKMHETTDLTHRQKEVEALAIQGLSNKEIGDKLCISPFTVRSHLQHIFEIYAVNNRTQLALHFFAKENTLMQFTVC